MAAIRVYKFALWHILEDYKGLRKENLPYKCKFCPMQVKAKNARVHFIKSHKDILMQGLREGWVVRDEENAKKEKERHIKERGKPAKKGRKKIRNRDGK